MDIENIHSHIKINNEKNKVCLTKPKKIQDKFPIIEKSMERFPDIKSQLLTYKIKQEEEKENKKKELLLINQK